MKREKTGGRTASRLSIILQRSLFSTVGSAADAGDDWCCAACLFIDPFNHNGHQQVQRQDQDENQDKSDHGVFQRAFGFFALLRFFHIAKFFTGGRPGRSWEAGQSRGVPDTVPEEALPSFRDVGVDLVELEEEEVVLLMDDSTPAVAESLPKYMKA